MKKKISIIIATYNADKTIKRCIDSIVSQKTDEIELVVVDGYSTDRTMIVLESYGKAIDVLISEPDKGVYDAWNKALKLVSGEWIMFVGADDYLLPDAMAFYLEFLQKKEDINSIDIICAKCRLINADGKYMRSFGIPYNWERFINKMEISHGSTLHNYRLFNELGLFNINFKICADYDFLLRKKMSSLFIEKEIFVMQIGGMSDSVKGLLDTYKIKQRHRVSYWYRNLYYLVKGICGYYWRLLWYWTKK